MNAVYLHLLHCRFEVFTGQQSGGREVDFVARRGDKIIYIQATYLLSDDTTRQREFGKLTDGIQHLHLATFLQMDL